MSAATRTAQPAQPTLTGLLFKRVVARHWHVRPPASPQAFQDDPWDQDERPTADLHLYETFTPDERPRTGTSFMLRADWLTHFNPHGLEVTRDEALHALCGQLNAALPSLATQSAERALNLHLTPLTTPMIRQVQAHKRTSDKLRRIIELLQGRAEENDRTFCAQMSPVLPQSMVIATLNHHFQTVPDSPLRLQWAQRPDDLIVLSPAETSPAAAGRFPHSSLPWGEISHETIVAASPEGLLTPFMGRRDLTAMFITREVLLRAQTDPDWTLPISSEPVQRSDVDAARPLTLPRLQVALPDQTPGEATLRRGQTPLIRARLEGHTLTALDWLGTDDNTHPGALAEALLGHLSARVAELDHALTGQQADHWFRYWALA